MSTQLLAKAAWLSESLTLKYFGTNEHLLTSIITAGYQRVVEHIKGRLDEADPFLFLRKVISLPWVLVSKNSRF